MQFSTQVEISDRGLAYGDGFFTTAKIIESQVEHWDLHLERLVECASRLGFPKFDSEKLNSTVTEMIAGCLLGTLKIIITRGSGGRGYEPPFEPEIKVYIQVLPFPSHYPSWIDKGLCLGLSAIRLAHQPLLAGLKTLNRLEQVLIKQALTELAYDDVLVMDYADNIIETSTGNILLHKDGNWLTPDLTNCGIQGVKLKATKRKLAVQVVDLTLEDILSGDALFVCNSLMGLVPVASFLEKSWNVEASLRLLKNTDLYA